MSIHRHPDIPSDVIAIGAATLAADNTPTVIDVGRFQCTQLLLGVGVGGITFDATNKIEFVLRHGNLLANGNAPAWSDLTAVEAKDVQLPSGVTLGSGGIVLSLVAAHAAASFRTIDYVGGRGFIALLADFSGTHGTGTPINAVVRRLRGHRNPA